MAEQEIRECSECRELESEKFVLIEVVGKLLCEDCDRYRKEHLDEEGL